MKKLLPKSRMLQPSVFSVMQWLTCATIVAEINKFHVLVFILSKLCLTTVIVLI